MVVEDCSRSNRSINQMITGRSRLECTYVRVCKQMYTCSMPILGDQWHALEFKNDFLTLNSLICTVCIIWKKSEKEKAELQYVPHRH